LKADQAHTTPGDLLLLLPLHIAADLLQAEAATHQVQAFPVHLAVAAAVAAAAAADPDLLQEGPRAVEGKQQIIFWPH